MSKILVDSLYKKVEDSLSNKANLQKFKSDLDIYMSKNMEIYSAPGPSKRPIFSEKNIDDLFKATGLTHQEVGQALKAVQKQFHSQLQVASTPVYTPITLSFRYFLIKKDDANVDRCLGYLIVSMYPMLHYRYYKSFGQEPNPAAMAYTLNNLSNKFSIKNANTLWEALMNLERTCLEYFKKDLIRGDDEDILKFINSSRTRMNSFLRKITNEFMEVLSSKKYLGTEFESFDEEDYHEADSDTYAIDRIVTKVTQSLVVHGPDMRIVELSAKNCKVSVNMLRSYVTIMVNGEHREDIQHIVEALIYLFVQNTDDVGHPVSEVGTNNFFIHCMKVYKKSNTIDPNVIKVKKILDKWLVELKIAEYTSRKGTVNDFRRALYMFFVLTIVKTA